MDLGNVNSKSIEEILSLKKARQIKLDNKKMILSEEVCQICRGRMFDTRTNKRIKDSKLSTQDILKAAYSYYSRFGIKEFIRKAKSQFFFS